MNRLTTAGLLLCMLFFSWSTHASVDLFPVSHVAPGLEGVGYTVLSGTEIEEFPVEVLGVLPQAGPSGDLIMVQVAGDNLDGLGIAAGMSGSPIYVDDKLLGAIGYGLRMADQSIGLVTPAADMMRVLDLVVQDSDDPPASSHPVPSALEGIDPLGTPLLISGFGRRTAGMLTDWFRPLGRPVLQGAGSSSDGLETPPIAPGSAIAIQLVRGDVEISSIGTVTIVDGDRFAALGHSMLERGASAYFASGASIVRTISSTEMPFKIAVSHQPIGTVLQDRGAAVAGRIDQEPRFVDLHIAVHDDDRNHTEYVSAEVIFDDLFTVPLVVVTALQGLDEGLDRFGAGTASVAFEISGDGLSRPLLRENLQYSPTDIAALSLWELYDALRRLQSNAFRAPGLTAVHLDVKVSETRRTARIERVRPVERRVAAGDEVDVEVTLLPFRQPPVTVTIPVRIPEDTVPGPLAMTVRGEDTGVFADFSTLLEGYFVDPTDPDEWEEDFDGTESASFDRLVEEIQSAPRANDLIIEFYPTTRGRNVNTPSPENADSFGAEQDEGSQLLPVQIAHPTDYVIQGLFSFQVRIIRPPAAEDVSDETSDAVDEEPDAPTPDSSADEAAPDDADRDLDASDDTETDEPENE